MITLLQNYQKKTLKYSFYLLLGVLLDQFTKLYVHFNMGIGSAHEIKLIGNWFKIHYILNPGMAWGLEFGSAYGKLLLNLFRIVAIIVLTKFLYKSIHKQRSAICIWSSLLILAGAIGNSIDSIFYGVFLKNAPYNVLTPWFHGQVIDMIYFDLWEGKIPEKFPLLGGKYLSLWPIFNLADVFISIGAMLFCFLNKEFNKFSLPLSKIN